MHCFAYSITAQRYSIVGCHKDARGFTLTASLRAQWPHTDQPPATAGSETVTKARCARESIEVLRLAITRNRDVAETCDPDFRNQLLILTNEMESYLRVLVGTLPESRAE